jgi:putative PIN family toxin of toxin-antitoxin system
VEKRPERPLVVVLDTNVLLSHFWGGETISRVVDALSDGVIECAATRETLREFWEVGHRGKFSKRFSPEVFADFYQAYEGICRIVTPRVTVTAGVDPKDNKFLECALSAKADYLVTGDSHLLDLGHFGHAMIVTPAAFVRMALS